MQKSNSKPSNQTHDEPLNLTLDSESKKIDLGNAAENMKELQPILDVKMHFFMELNRSNQSKRILFVPDPFKMGLKKKDANGKQ